MNKLKLSKMNMCIVVITLIITVTILYFNDYRYYGYKVSIESNAITFVKSKSGFNETYKELQNELKLKYSNVVMPNDFTLDKVKVDDDIMFTNESELKKIMLKKFDIVVDALEMKSDSRKIAYVSSENQGKEILTSIKHYYSKTIKPSGIKSDDIENKISYESVKVKTGDLYENSEIVREVIKYNDKLPIPLIRVKIVANIVKDQEVLPKTIMTSSSELMSGVNKTIHEGGSGTKKVSKIITFINNKVVSQEILSSEITKPVQNKMVSVGTKKNTTLVASSINSPSRGSISSPFGQRWGKMHKGIDIAASFGEPISAALDGNVSYEGWETGYGNVIKIDHGDGIETIYAHCSVITVKKGETVSRGAKIGEVGSTGNSTGPHLHFEVRENDVPINPQEYIK